MKDGDIFYARWKIELIVHCCISLKYVHYASFAVGRVRLSK